MGSMAHATQPIVLRWALVVHVFFLRAAAYFYTDPAKFLIVSNGQSGSIMYGKIPLHGAITELKTLVKAGAGLMHPQGLAIDQRRKLLLVADSGINKVVSYGLFLSGEELVVGDQITLAEDVEARWVTVDGVGNVYFTCEVNHRIMMISAKDVEDGSGKGTVIFDDSNASVGGVSGPGGIATDNFFLYWTNKVDSLTHGTVVRNLKDRRVGGGLPLETRTFAKRSPKAYGLCVAKDQMFYTEGDNVLQGMPKAGGEPVVISDELQQPRGCAWDGEGQLYVADRKAHAVFALPAPMLSLGRTEPVKVLDMEEAFGVAVFSAAASMRAGWWCIQAAMMFLVTYLGSSAGHANT
jgi:sugar lactone lactonase YvrE